MSKLVFNEKLNVNSPKGYVVSIDGSKCRNSADFLRCIWNKFDFPMEDPSWDAYLDWICDLSWIKEKDIMLIIDNYDLLLVDQPDVKKFFIDDIKNVVIPFWNNDAVDVFGEEGKKNISIYCNEGTSDFCNTREAFSKIQRDIIGGIKVPHGTSQPVIYKENGKYYLAAYVFYYSREDIENGAVDRPAVWAIADIKTGEIIKRYETKEKDFSNAPYNVKYNIRSSEKYDTSAEYYRKAFAELDFVRKMLIETGQFFKHEYSSYLEKIVKNIPNEYKRFLYDLSV